MDLIKEKSEWLSETKAQMTQWRISLLPWALCTFGGELGVNTMDVNLKTPFTSANTLQDIFEMSIVGPKVKRKIDKNSIYFT